MAKQKNTTAPGANEAPGTNEAQAAADTRTLAERMYEAMTALDFIAKDKTNTFHRYNYASDYAIKGAVHAELVRNRINFTVSFRDLIQKADSGLIFVIYDYKFSSVDQPDDAITGQFIGSGEDKNDKALYKAITGAIKYLLTSTFLIPTGDDPEVHEDRTQQRISTQPVMKTAAETQSAPKANQITPNEAAAETKPALPPQKIRRTISINAAAQAETTQRPKLDAKALQQYCDRIRRGDTALADRVAEYYAIDMTQRAALLDAVNETANKPAEQN